MTALRTGELSALAGGHFLTGAWALVMLYDHAHGTDFASEGLEQVRPMFTLLDKSQIDRYEHRISAPLAPLDFRSYSKHLNPRLRRYGFELKHLLR